jgi:hypothetical protein
MHSVYGVLLVSLLHPLMLVPVYTAAGFLRWFRITPAVGIPVAALFAPVGFVIGTAFEGRFDIGLVPQHFLFGLIQASAVWGFFSLPSIGWRR